MIPIFWTIVILGWWHTDNIYCLASSRVLLRGGFFTLGKKRCLECLLSVKLWTEVYIEDDFCFNSFNSCGAKSLISNEVKTSTSSLKDLYILKKAYLQLKEAYHSSRMVHKLLVASTNQNHFTDIIERSSNGSAAVWNIIRQCCLDISINDGNNISDALQAIATKFNDFFATSVADAVSSIPYVLTEGNTSW